jgi:peptidoglycan/LPS O-acetylase OafA/YrhL
MRCVSSFAIGRRQPPNRIALENGTDTDIMKPAVSSYLNLMRLLAAVAVLIGHAGWQKISGGLFWQLTDYGQDAVTVFFVLSGFVIAYVTDRRETEAVTYALHRAARIYSVALPALLLTFLADLVRCHYQPVAALGGVCGGYYAIAASTFPIGLVFLGEVWNLHSIPGSNLPYWSLGFEVPYYLIFGVYHFMPRPWNRILASLLLVGFGPKVASMFVVWLTGFACYRLSKRLSCRGPARTGLVLWLASTFALGAVVAPANVPYILSLAFTTDGIWAWLHYFLVGILVAANILAVHLAGDALGPLARRLGPAIGWMAGATFSIYLFHMPLLTLVAAVSPWPVTSWPTRALVFVGVPAVILALAEVTERRKDPWRNGLLLLGRQMHLVART